MNIIDKHKINYYDIPIVLFLFKRSDTVIQILKIIRQVKPSKIYLLGDNGRTPDEIEEVKKARAVIENEIDWDCKIIKRYFDENVGVYENIGLGAKWVFEREKAAVFLEDDNLPELSFFNYCKELLQKYYDNDKIIWICGTNYLGKYYPNDNSSYVFTKHLLPCGWASWSHKFLKYYDGDLIYADDKTLKVLRKSYVSKRLYRQQKYAIQKELFRKQNGFRFISWDFQMGFSIRHFNKYGISPCHNQIKNIGVDSNSIHGGNSYKLKMTKRFCGVDSYPLNDKIIHPKKILVDKNYEKKVNDIILLPLLLRVRSRVKRIILKLLGKNEAFSFKEPFSKEKKKDNL